MALIKNKEISGYAVPSGYQIKNLMSRGILIIVGTYFGNIHCETKCFYGSASELA